MKVGKFEQYLYDAGSWAIYFAEAPIGSTTERYRKIIGDEISEDVEIKSQGAMGYFPGGCAIATRNSNWTIIQHRVGEWVKFDTESLAEDLQCRVVEFAGEDTSGHVESSLIEADRTRVRYQTKEDTEYEDGLYEEVMEYLGEDQSPPPQPPEATTVENYTSFFESLGIEPLFVTINKKGQVLATPDVFEKITRVDLADQSEMLKCI